MKNEKEIQKEIDETTALVRDTTQIFIDGIRAYFARVGEDLQRVIAKSGGGEMSAKTRKEVRSIMEAMREVIAISRRHSIINERAVKVVNHKNEVKAYERLTVALDRMREEAKDFQAKIRGLTRTS